MKIKIKSYVLGFLIGLVFIISIVRIRRLKINNAEMELQLKECKNKISILENLKYEPEGSLQFYGHFQGTDKFSNVINTNPIDRDYEAESSSYSGSGNFTTLGWSAMNGRYTVKWEKEIDATLDYLYNQLSMKDGERLKQSQFSWQLALDNEVEFVSNKFIDNRALGTLGDIHLSALIYSRTRERAIDLMEYIYIIDREALTFIYDKSK